MLGVGSAPISCGSIQQGSWALKVPGGKEGLSRAEQSRAEWSMQSRAKQSMQEQLPRLQFECHALHALQNFPCLV